MKAFSNMLIFLSISVVTALFLLYIFQNKLIYPAPKPPLKVSLSEHMTKIDLGYSDSFLLMPKLPSDKLIPLMIFTHGNAELASDWLHEFEPLIEKNIAVLIIEYPGYGGSSVTTNIKTINETMLRAYDYVTKLPRIDKTKIFAYGRSIGGGAAILLAKQRPLSALCLESTFSSFPKLVAEKGFPSFLVSDRYDNEEIIKTLDIPIFLYHGINDELIPFTHAEALVNAGKNVTFYSENCGHNNCPRKWKELFTFLQKNSLD